MQKMIQKLAERKRQLSEEKGFSLVELAVVIVVIGVLVAIAIPVFGGIQDGAESAKKEAAAANGASLVAAEIASGEDTKADLDLKLDALQDDGLFVALSSATADPVSLADYCVEVSATEGGAAVANKGPSCVAIP